MKKIYLCFVFVLSVGGCVDSAGVGAGSAYGGTETGNTGTGGAQGSIQPGVSQIADKLCDMAYLCHARNLKIQNCYDHNAEFAIGTKLGLAENQTVKAIRAREESSEIQAQPIALMTCLEEIRITQCDLPEVSELQSENPNYEKLVTTLSDEGACSKVYQKK
jgi:hypothetical protein